MFWFLVKLAIMVALSYALAPKASSPKKATLEDFNFPTAEEGRPYPILFGTRRITGSNVTWFGDLRIRKIKG